MLISVRCQSCGAALSDVAGIYRYIRQKRIQQYLETNDVLANQFINDGCSNVEMSDVLDNLRIYTLCCRIHLTTGMNIIDYY